VTKAATDSHTVDCVGVITSAESQAISPLSDGAVMKVLVKDGDFVRAGDLIAQLDTADLKDQLAKVEGDRARAAGDAGRAYAEAANAERKASLMRRMAAAGVSSESEYRDAVATASGAGAVRSRCDEGGRCADQGDAASHHGRRPEGADGRHRVRHQVPRR
jgi:multidrug efflux pump subunit AcrA (membrane-fusion protein)